MRKSSLPVILTVRGTHRHNRYERSGGKIVLKLLYRASITFLLLAASFYCIPRLANAQIAPGVLQSAAQTATITGTVVQSDGSAVAGADVRLSGLAFLSTKSDSHGTFSFTSVPYGTYRIDVRFTSLGVAARENIIVKGDISVSIQYTAATTGGFKEIARVSTHSAGAQINVTPASIASINPSDYAFEGNVSWQQLLNRIPGVTVSGGLAGGQQPTDNLPGSPIVPIILSINGALPYETSVTLDGMPLQNESTTVAPGNGFDLSALPMSVFETADVVRGPGANAPSIVDSIGGSFVLHAPGHVEKNTLMFSVSNDPYGGIVSNIKATFRTGRLSAVFTYGVNDSPGPFGNTSIVQAYSYNPKTVNGQTFNGCSSGGPSRCASFIFCPNFSSVPCSIQDKLLYCCLPYSTVWSQHNGALALSYDVTSAITAQIFYAGTSSYVPDPYGSRQLSFTPAAGYAGSIAPGNYTNIYLNAYNLYQASSLLEEKVTAYVKRGVIRLAALQNTSWFPENQMFGTTYPAGQYTLYGVGYYASAPTTPVYFNGTPATLTFNPCAYNTVSWVRNRDLLASYAVQLGEASHAGISYVSSYYDNPSWSDFNFSGFTGSSSQSSANSATTTELRLNAGTTLSDKLSLDASWYIARGLYHVQDPSNPASPWNDSTFSYSAPRLGATWQVGRDIAIRAAAGGGYALPPLGDLLGSVNVPPSCIAGTCTVSETNLNLKPETSFGFDFGTDVRLHHDTILSLDLYRTNLYGQFFTTTTTSTYNGSACGAPPCTLYTSQNNNLQQSRYEGINVDIRHDVTHGFYWNGSVGLTRSYVVSLPPGFYNSGSTTCNFRTGAGCTNTYIIPGSNFNGSAFSGIPSIPYANGTLQLGYRWDSRKYVDLSPTYYGNGNPYFEPAFMEFDAQAGYPLTSTVSLLATFRNITNIYGQSYGLVGNPSLAVPTITGLPYALFGIPYGPRSLIVTLKLGL